MDTEKNLSEVEKNLSEHLVEMFMTAQIFDAKEPKSDVAAQFHRDMITLFDMLKHERYDQVKEVIDRAINKIFLETLIVLFGDLEED